MFEFRISRKNVPLFVKDIQPRYRPAPPPPQGTTTNYSLNFQNMFANINNVKPGCRKCRGTY